MSILVPAQTDYNFSKISSNQCSWVAWEFIIKYKELSETIYFPKIITFIDNYRECMKKGSELRFATKVNLYGENIDTPSILEYYQDKVKIEETYTIIKNEDKNFLEILHPDLLREFYSRTHLIINENELDNILANIYENTQALLVSRHGQSLAILPTINNNYIICDSHLHYVQIIDKEKTMKHILMDHNGHLHLTIILINL
jgi:hypothetical protein